MNSIQKEPEDRSYLPLEHLKILGGIGLGLLLLAVLLWPGNPLGFQLRAAISPSTTPNPPTASPTLTLLPSPTLSPTPVQPIETPSPSLLEEFPAVYGSLILSIRDQNHHHLYIYHPLVEGSSQNQLQGLPLTRITSGDFDDLHPAVSPDGTQIAFSSNREGPWDIYVMDVSSGRIRKFTDTLAYEGNPTWSPDGQFLAFESYQNNNLEIIIEDLDQQQGPINLTNHPAADHSPHWSPQGRRISYISLRSGSPQVWYADLDSPAADKAVQVSDQKQSIQQHPIWSGDGNFLSWSSLTQEGERWITTWDLSQENGNMQVLGTGDWPVWGQAGELVYAVVNTPQKSFLSAYSANPENFGIMLPAVEMPGPVSGISWSGSPELERIPAAQDQGLNNFSKQDQKTTAGETKAALINLQDVSAPFPQLSETAVDSFQSLRAVTAEQLGWDFLAELENAYVPYSEPLEPGYLSQNWLYTGRGIAVSDLPRRAGWMVLVREEFGSETYWRLFLKTGSQQGYLGQPLKDLPWDFSARFSGLNEYYEQGGKRSDSIPSGYYLDFTEIAAAHGWERLPALPVWQSSSAAARYQKYVYKENLTWFNAMLELYAENEIQP